MPAITTENIQEGAFLPETDDFLDKIDFSAGQTLRDDLAPEFQGQSRKKGLIPFRHEVFS
jgi:hypothetical protein